MTAALEGGEWSVARPGRSLPRERPGAHCTGGWVGPRAGLDGRKNVVPIGIRSRTVQHVVSRYTDWATRLIQLSIEYVVHFVGCMLYTRKCRVYALWLRCVRLYHSCPHYLIRGRISWKKVIEHKIVFRFSLQLLSQMFPNLRRIQWHAVCHRCTYISLHAHAQYRHSVTRCHRCTYIALHAHAWYRHSCQILTKLEFSRRTFGKYSNTKFQENPSSGIRVFHADGQTDFTKLSRFFAILRSRPKSCCQHSRSPATHDPSISRLQGTFDSQPTATPIILLPLI